MESNLFLFTIFRYFPSTASYDKGHYTSILLLYQLRGPLKYCMRCSKAWLQSQVKLRGICGGKIVVGAGFLGVLRFPLQILILLTAPYSLIILRTQLCSLDIDKRR
jgi:hypothetical protein